MNKKGFTLIELLGVILILSLLILLVLPNITNSVRNHSKKTDELTLSIIKNAAKLYIDDNSSRFEKLNGQTYCITIKELIEKEYLKEPIEYNGEDITDTNSLKVTYSGGFDYELVDVICGYPPKEYQRVEYIESTGTQYIDTGFTPTGKLTVYGKVNISEPTNEIAIVGTEASGWELGFSSAASNSNRMFSYLRDKGSITLVTESSIYNTILEFWAVNNYTNSFRSLRLNVDNSYAEVNEVSNAYLSNLLLFRYIDGYSFVGKCYNIKIYDNDILVRDFVPCYRKSDNVIGLYDLVNDKFYTNAGTGTFEKGANV